MMQLLFAVGAALASSRPVPANLAASLPHTPAPLASIVVADIDRDGDADVVATDDALHLFVWINDGTGRYTQQKPATGARCAGTERPNVGDDAPVADPLAASDPPTIDAPAVAHAEPLVAAGTVARGTAGGHRPSPQAAHALRGPPVDSPRV
jgi:hypothetical protein